MTEFDTAAYVSGFVQNIINAVTDPLDPECARGQLRYPELHPALEAGEEVWVPVVGFDNYEVSSLGKARNKNPTAKQRIKGRANLRPNNHESGYQSFCLYLNSKDAKGVLVHIAVRNSFYINLNPGHLTTVEHDDTDPGNNRLGNLLFASMKYQNQLCNKLPNPKSNAVKLSRPVEMRDLKDNRVIMTHPGLAAAEAWLRLNGRPRATYSTICHCTKGRRKSAFGYNWTYADQLLVGVGEEEIWRPIPVGVLPHDEDGEYLASTMGRIQNCHGQVYEGSLTVHGYMTFSTIPLHRVIALTFLENDDPVNKPLVKHKNNVKHDCRLANLIWGTHSENTQEAHDDGIINQINSCTPVRAINIETNEVVVYAKAKDVCQAYNICATSLKHRLNDGLAMKKIPYRFERILTPH